MQILGVGTVYQEDIWSNLHSRGLPWASHPNLGLRKIQSRQTLVVFVILSLSYMKGTKLKPNEVEPTVGLTIFCTTNRFKFQSNQNGSH